MKDITQEQFVELIGKVLENTPSKFTRIMVREVLKAIDAAMCNAFADKSVEGVRMTESLHFAMKLRPSKQFKNPHTGNVEASKSRYFASLRPTKSAHEALNQRFREVTKPEVASVPAPDAPGHEFD